MSEFFRPRILSERRLRQLIAEELARVSVVGGAGAAVKSVREVGVVGDGVANDTSAFQAVCNAGGAWFIPGDAVIRLTAPVAIQKPVMFFGPGVVPYQDINETAANVRGPGAWFHIAHTGVGFDIDGTSASADSMSVLFHGCGTFRTQPTPGGGSWTPTAHSWDFDIRDADVHFRDFCALNPTRFCRGMLTRGGRLRMDNVVGQPLLAGIEVDEAYDTVALDCRFWPYWSLNADVRDYTLANLVALRTFRVDGLRLSSFFSLHHYYGWLVDKSTAGSVNYAHGDKVYLDAGVEGLVVSSAVTDATIHVNDLLVYGQASVAGSIGISVAGSGLRLTASRCVLDTFGGFGAYLGGSGNVVQLDQLRLRNWGYSGAGVQGIVSDGTGNVVRLLSAPEEINLGGRPFSVGISGGVVQRVDVPPGGATGQVLRKATGADYDVEWGAPSSGTFLALTDTPGSYSGQAHLVPRVNAAETALAFARADAAWAVRILTADQTMTDSTATQNLFSSDSGISLDANSTYEFELLIFVTQGSTSSTVALSFDDVSGGTIAWQARGTKAAINGSGTGQTAGHYTTFTTARNLAAAATTTGLLAHVLGTLRTGAGGGTFRPRVAQSAASGAFTILRGTMARVRRLGTDSLTNTGEWA